ncbi:MAG: CHAT domain-containing protein [Stigonema ocellatum SAG 48.90 = DSM 106950]|nr:CHAT domain-containing protein [Stigonema ocellatum SAG 48.90 = DSM 106950]
MVIIILFLAANPKGTTQLRLDQEVRDISEGLLRSQNRDRFRLEQRWAVRSRDVQRALLDLNPQIVHFSGHGAGNKGLVFESKRATSQEPRDVATERELEENEILAFPDNENASFVNASTLANLFKLFSDKVTCVLLNGCYTEIQAKAIAQYIPYVIGMKRPISDRAAIDFAVGFYDALGAGRSIEFAYKSGCTAIQMAGVPEHLTPILYSKQEMDIVSNQSDPATSEAIFIEEATSISHLSKRRIKEKQKDLEEEYNELRQKLKKLKKDLIIEADSEVKYKLEKRIEEYEVKLQQIEEKLEHLETE